MGPPPAITNFTAARPALRDALEEAGLLEHLELGPEPEWSYLNRMIVASKGDVPLAIQQIEEHQEFLRQKQLAESYRWPANKILGGKCSAKQIDDLFPMYIIGRDLQGFPVLYLKAGKLNVKKLLRLVSSEELVSYHSWVLQRLTWMSDELKRREDKSYTTDERDELPSRFTAVLDASGASISQVSSSFYVNVQRMLRVDENFHPERMLRTVVIRPPFIFHSIWRIVRNFLDPDTLAKFAVVRSGYQAHLGSLIDPSQLPKDYGGLAPALCDDDYASRVTERFFHGSDALPTL